MAVLTLRLVKGSPLTNSEIDNNFSNINSEVTINTSNIGVLSQLTTTAKSNLVSAINEVKANASGNASITGGSIQLVQISNSAIIGNVYVVANTSTPAFRISQAGIGDAIVVEDTANPDSTPFVVSTDGRVGVGVQSSGIIAGAGLQIQGEVSTDTVDTYLRRAESSQASANVYIDKLRGTFASPAIVASGDLIGTYHFRGYDGVNSNVAATIAVKVDGTPGAANMPGRIELATTPANGLTPVIRATLYSTGNVRIHSLATSSAVFTDSLGNLASGTLAITQGGTGATTASVARNNLGINVIAVTNVFPIGVVTTANIANITHLVSGVAASTYGGSTNVPVFTVDSTGHVTSASNVSFTGGATITNTSAINASTFYIGMANNQTSGTWTEAYISSTKLYFNPSTGTLNATVFNSLSDERFKDNISIINNAVETVRKLDGVSFTWKDSGIKSYGLVAQKIQDTLPELVNDSNDQKTVNYSGIIAFLVNAVKELDARVQQLENK